MVPLLPVAGWSFCHYLQHFASPATAQQWTAAHPGTFVISLNAATELARRHAARAFGAMSSPAPDTR
jgi:hypothetical protein